MEPDLNDGLRELKKTPDALEQSVGLNRILLTLIDNLKRTQRWTCVLLVLSILCNVAICAIFVAYESQFTTVTETITIDQDSGEGSGNNVYQSGENAQYVQEGVTDNGPTEDYNREDDQNP